MGRRGYATNCFTLGDSLIGFSKYAFPLLSTMGRGYVIAYFGGLLRFLGWEDPLEKGKATHSSILAWRIPWTTVHGVAKSRTRLSDFHFHFSQDLLSSVKY